MTLSCWQQDLAEPMSWQGDVAIVGAGIAGLSLAYWLKELAPELSVAILEAQDVGAGASGRNAGFNTAGSTFYLAQLAQKYGESHAEAYWDFKQESLRLMREQLFSRLRVSHDLWGSTTLYRNSGEYQLHRELVTRLSRSAPLVVSAEQLLQQGLGGFCGGLNFAHEGRVHSMGLLQAMRAELIERGVHIYTQQAVGWGEALSDAVALHCARGKATAQHVFLALNGYAARFHPELANWVVPKRAQMVALASGEWRLPGNFYDPAHKVYFRQAPELTSAPLLIGGMRLLDEMAENTESDHVSPVIQQALQDYGERILGYKAPVLGRWSGTMGFTPEEKPYVRAVPFLKHTTFVGGFSGHGMGVAFGTAQLAVLRFLGRSDAKNSILPC